MTLADEYAASLPVLLRRPLTQEERSDLVAVIDEVDKRHRLLPLTSSSVMAFVLEIDKVVRKWLEDKLGDEEDPRGVEPDSGGPNGTKP